MALYPWQTYFLACLIAVLRCTAPSAAVRPEQEDVEAPLGALVCLAGSVSAAGGQPLPAWLHARSREGDVCGVPLPVDAGQHLLARPALTAGDDEDVFALTVMPASSHNCPTVAVRAHLLDHEMQSHAALARLRLVAAAAALAGLANTSVALLSFDFTADEPNQADGTT